jgi:branched-chain amino acid transport system ATP-binding protein
MGLVPITEGRISFENNVISASPPIRSGAQKGFTRTSGTMMRTDKIVTAGLTLVPEGRRVFTELTVLENLELGAYLVQDKKLIITRIREQFDFFPVLKERSGQKAGSLSGGEQQMLAISRALMSSPRLLLLDEPGLGLAPLVVNAIFNIIKTINTEKKVTVFLVEQNAKKALGISSRGYVMQTGLITLHDTSDNLLADDKVKAAYLGEN